MPLTRDLGIDLWDDTKIKSGMNWRQAVNDAMQTARVAILLVSADFLASEFIVKNELSPLLAAASNEGTLILPVILSAQRISSTGQVAFLKLTMSIEMILTPERDLVGSDRLSTNCPIQAVRS